MQLQNKVQNTTFFGNYSFKTPIQPETQKLIETERWRVFLVSYFTFCKLMSWKEGLWNFVSRKKPVCTSEWCEKHLPLTSLPLCVLHFSFLNTLCSFSIISQSVCLTGIVWRKKGKRNTRRDTQLSSTTDWNCKVILKSERRGERKRRSLACPVSLQRAVCVCVCVAQRRWTKSSSSNRWMIHS